MCSSTTSSYANAINIDAIKFPVPCKRILGIMISKLLPGEQLFFTTHNETIMEENYPKHSFVFLVREDNQIKAKYANDYVQKPTDNLRRAVENDVIRMIPDDSNLDILED